MAQLLSKIGSSLSAARKAWQFGSCAPQSQVFNLSEDLDGRYLPLPSGLTFKQLKSLVLSADNGELSRGLQLYEAMETRDPHLRSVADTRRLSLTGLDWEVVSAADVQSNIEDRSLADEAASFVRETLTNLPTFDDTLEHLSKAVTSNLAVVELIWQRCHLIDTIDIPSWRLRSEPREPGVIRIVTDGDWEGTPAESPKFVIHIPHGDKIFPLSKSLMRSQASLWLIKDYALGNWSMFVEIFGMPTRWASYQPGTHQADVKEIIKMLKNMGSVAWGAFTNNVDLKFVESNSRGVAPYEALIAWCDRKQSILMLGGNLTSDTTGGTGTLAAGSVQDAVKDDLRDDDIKREGRTIRRQIIAPVCAFAYPHRDVPLPYFRRRKPETIDRIREANLFAATQKFGLPVSKNHAYDRLGIPKPQEGDDLIEETLGAFGEVQEGF